MLDYVIEQQNIMPENMKMSRNTEKHYFDQLSCARSTQKLIKIHNTQIS